MMINREFEKLKHELIRIEIKTDELIGDYIAISRPHSQERDSIIVKIVDADSYVLGELVITDGMKVFYNHKKRVSV